MRGLASAPGLLAALWLLASSAPARAATSVAGDVGDQIWTTAGSPYNLTATVTVPAGKTLTIEAGVCVVAGVEAAAVTFDVEGTLTVNGTRESPVTFDSASGLARSWAGILVRGAAYGRGLIVRHGQNGISSYGGVLNLRDSLFEDTGFAGVQLSSGVATLDAIVARGNENGVFSWSGMLLLINSLIVGSGLNGVGLNGGSSNTVTNCTISGNRIGVYVHTPGTVVVRNSIVTNNGFGIQSDISLPDVTVISSDIFGNTTANFDRVTPGQGCISVAPMFLGAGDYHLAAGSPCVDTGVAGDPNDHDLDRVPRPFGAAVDMGAYERTDGAGGSGAGGAASCHGAGGEGGLGSDAGSDADASGAGGGAGGGVGGGFGGARDAGSAPGGSAGASGTAPDAGGAVDSGGDASADVRGPGRARRGCRCGAAPADASPWAVAVIGAGVLAVRRRRRVQR